MRALVGMALVACVGAADASALQECRRSQGDAAQVLLCLRQARQAATDAMLESFLAAEQKVAALGEPASDQVRGAFKQSQRAFERYLSEHCHTALTAGSEAAGIACETDLLRQRAGTLEALEIPTRRH